MKALDGVSFNLQKGEIHALCGENGAGKSTLIKVLCGFHPAGSYGGEIRLGDTLLQFRNLRAAEEHGIALIAQELALVPELSVAENMSLGREPVRNGLIQWDKVRAEALRGLQLVGLDVNPDRPVKELGIGQQQMVEIGKALMKNAEILVLDEPTAALTEADVQVLLEFLKGLRARGVSCIYISHRLEEVFQIADRITVIRDGRSVGTEDAAKLNQDMVIAMMVGRSVTNLYPRASTQQGDIALAVKDWTMEDPQNPGRHVIKDISFEVRKGEVLGISGLMGAGRTALVSSIFGAGRGNVTGTINVAGCSQTTPFRAPSDAIAAGLALVSEDRKRFGLVLQASIMENMTLVTLRQFVKNGLLNHGERARQSTIQFESLRVRAPGLSTLVGQLSGGNQQKVVLGKWLMAAPRVLILDEPTRGIDVGAKAEIYQLISQFAAEGLAVILVSSDLPEILGMSHRVIVLSQGRQTGCLDHLEATPERVMAAATRKVIS